MSESRDAELIRRIKEEGRETFGTGRLRTRYRRCYEIVEKKLSPRERGAR
jgi:hypothetical protein